MMSLEKQLNWSVKCACLRSKFNYSAALRKSKSFIGMVKGIELKCVTYLYKYFTIKRQAFTNKMRLPTFIHRINQRTKQIIFDNHCSTALQKYFFFHMTSEKWNSLPSNLRNFDITCTTSTFKNKLKEFCTTEMKSIPMLHAYI